MATVTDPDGGEWTVRRRWIPHRAGIGLTARLRGRRRRKGKGAKKGEDGRWYDSVDLGSGCFDLDGILVVVGLVAGVFLLIFVGLPLLLLLLDLVWLVAVLVIGVAGRVLLGRPWDVEAMGPDRTRRRWRVKGFRAAGRRAEEVGQHIALGVTLRPDEVLPE